MSETGRSWGRLGSGVQNVQKIVSLDSRFSTGLPAGPVLAFGNGRSYGDVCLNDGGTLLRTRNLDRFIAFDPSTGMIECEAGVLLSEIIDLTLGHGWFLPVTPGTSFVTVGGAIANDVHGKNHHRLGSFGNHVIDLELLRSNGDILHCSADHQRPWFDATIGGLGLTGLIRKARLQLRPVAGAWIQGDSHRFANLAEFFHLARKSDADYEYTVAWIDCAARGRNLGRGIFMRGNHSALSRRPPAAGRLRVPFTPPVSLINEFSLRLFNQAYFHRPGAASADALWHYRAFFYPLDGVLEWNRVYGPRGFYQYQCVLPEALAHDALEQMLGLIQRRSTGSFLAVLKIFGDVPSRGLMSFARPGVTLALDFPNRGAATLELLDALDGITLATRGAVYPAKDARMSAQSFRSYFPAWESFRDFVDPQFSSSFWRRVMEGTQ